MAKSKLKIQPPTAHKGGQGGSESMVVHGKEQSLQTLTVKDFMLRPDLPDKPSFKKTKFPVMMDEFEKLKKASKKPDTGTKILKTQDTSYGETDMELKSVMTDVSEDATIMASMPSALAPSSLASFEALSQNGWTPPDCCLAVGASDVVTGVNVDMAGYSKTGTLNFKWAGFTSLFAGVLPSGARIFDPRMTYDTYAGRYIVVAGALRDSPQGSWILLGVSQTSSPSGSYWIWALDATADGSTHTSNWADYPSLGYDTQAIYITTNQFSFSSSGFQYAKLRILNKSEVYGGGVGGGHTIKWYDFWNLKDSNGGIAFTVQPCVHHRGIGGNPAGYLINSGFGAGSFLSLWTLNDPIGYWSGRSPSLVRDNISCRSYDLPPEADQPGSATNIATNDNRILNAVFQYAGGVQRVWACHTSKGTWAGDSSARAVLQWYEVDVISKTVIQQNYFGASGMYYFFPAIEVDINRNAFIVFSRSSASEYGSVRQTGRRVTDSLNTLQGSASVKTGEGVYNGGRWGDYFGICRDGADSTRIWGYGEYAKTGDRWGTWVYSAKF